MSGEANLQRQNIDEWLAGAGDEGWGSGRLLMGMRFLFKVMKIFETLIMGIVASLCK